MPRRILSALGSIALSAALWSSAVAQAPAVTVSSSDTPIDSYAYNSCNNETVHVIGTEHVLWKTFERGSSTKVSIFISFPNTKGVGMTTGARYVLAATEQEIDVLDSPAFSTDFMVNEQLIGQGSASNMGLHLTQTFTWDGSHYSFVTKRSVANCN